MVKVVRHLYADMIRAILQQRAARGLPVTAPFLASIWSALLGEDLARVTRPINLIEGTLEIACASPTWQQQMAQQQQRLLKLLNAQLPDPIHTLHFSLGSARQFPQHAAPAARATPPKPPVGSLPLAEAHLFDDVEDDDLRRIMIRVRRLDRGRKDEP